MKQKLIHLVKGMLIGAANVIPGVSGGTMALLTGIFEPLIHAAKSFDLQALKLLRTGDFKGFAAHTQLGFLMPIGAGILISILSLARLLGYLFEHHAIFVWAFFFGLILASIYFVGKRITRISLPIIALFALGTAGAAAISLVEPAAENTSTAYLLLCGAVAMCSMILPGLSGSYVLLLMGNYQLVMIDAVNQLNLAVLLPVAGGAGIGLLLFAQLLSWVFKRFHNQTLALLTGFISGSLVTLWPWKKAIRQHFGEGDALKEKVIGYTYHWPELSAATLWVFATILLGAGAIIAVERLAARKQ